MSETDICELKTPKMYLYLGHGADICDENGLLKKEIVPEGCIYVTIEECSHLSRFNDEAMVEGFVDDYNENEKILSCPENPMFRQKLAKLLQVKDVKKIHIHTPGSKYVDNIFNPMSLMFPTDGRVPYFTISGLLERQDIRAKLGNENYGCLEKSNDDKFKKDSIPLYYIASTWPTESYMKNMLEDYNGSSEYITTDKLEQLSYKMKRKVSDLMKEYPGIHYNVLCRGLADNCDTTKFTPTLRKEESRIEQDERNKNRSPSKGGYKRKTRRNKKIKKKTRKSRL